MVPASLNAMIHDSVLKLLLAGAGLAFLFA